jgi:hypothetical protein
MTLAITIPRQGNRAGEYEMKVSVLLPPLLTDESFETATDASYARRNSGLDNVFHAKFISVIRCESFADFSFTSG